LRGRDHFCAIAQIEIRTEFKKVFRDLFSNSSITRARCAKMIIFAQRLVLGWEALRLDDAANAL